MLFLLVFFRIAVVFFSNSVARFLLKVALIAESGIEEEASLLAFCCFLLFLSQMLAIVLFSIYVRQTYGDGSDDTNTNKGKESTSTSMLISNQYIYKERHTKLQLQRCSTHIHTHKQSESSYYK